MAVILYWPLYWLDRFLHLFTWGPFRRYGLARYRICNATWHQSIRADREDHFIGPPVQ